MYGSPAKIRLLESQPTVPACIGCSAKSSVARFGEPALVQQPPEDEPGQHDRRQVRAHLHRVVAERVRPEDLVLQLPGKRVQRAVAVQLGSDPVSR